MMITRRTRSLVALVVWTTCVQLGCGGGTPEREQAVSIETVDPTGQEIVFWYQHTRVREEALQEMIEQFNASNSFGIKVRGEFAGNYGDIYNKMVVGLQGGSLPDLLVAYQNQALEYHTADGIVDLGPYIAAEKWGLSDAEQADFVQAFLQQDRTQAGVQTGLPPNRSIEVVYYNADWLQELGADGPPQTWEEFARLCRAAHKQPFSDNPNKDRSLGFILDEDASRLASMVFSRGGSFLNDKGDGYTMDTPEVAASLQLMKGLVEDGSAEMMGEAYGDQSAFNVGECLFILRSTSGLPYVQEGVMSGADFAWDVAPPPHTTAEPVINFYGASISVGRTTPERQLAAWLFLKWFTSPTQQADWVRASNYFPARKSTRELLTDYFEANPRYRAAYALLDYGTPEPAVAGYEAVRRMISKAVVRVVQGGDISPVLQQLQREANATLEAY
jgi:multiple sugar transport system substrate-binding protein